MHHALTLLLPHNLVGRARCNCKVLQEQQSEQPAMTRNSMKRWTLACFTSACEFNPEKS